MGEVDQALALVAGGAKLRTTESTARNARWDGGLKCGGGGLV